MKSVQIRSFFWSVFFRIRTEYGEILFSRSAEKNLKTSSLHIRKENISYQFIAYHKQN